MTPRPQTAGERPFTVFFVVGEESGDQLGAGLMRALRRALDGRVAFMGLGGDRMIGEGLRSQFPISDISVMGISAVVSALPRILGRMKEAAAAAVAARPDVLVVIDSPDFSQRVARCVRRRDPRIPIVTYVSPQVWAWRPGRARRMADYVDHVLALLPFEPEFYRSHGGPPCSYVGHPLIEQIDRLRPSPGERVPLEAAGRPCLLVLPGSRRGEIERHMALFGEVVARIAAARGPVELVLPAVPYLADEIGRRAASWPVQPAIVVGEAGKHAAFRKAHAALAVSGTVSLELALSGVPMAIAYRVEPIVRPLKWLARFDSIVLPNLVLGENVVPEFIDQDANADRLVEAVLPLLSMSEARRRQAEAFGRLDALMTIPESTPSDRAALFVIETARSLRQPGEPAS